jgi:hypothetical protein
MSFGVLNEPPTYWRTLTKAFKEYLDNFMKIFLDDFFNPDKCVFMVFSGMNLGYIDSKKRKLLDPKKIQAIVTRHHLKIPRRFEYSMGWHNFTDDL